MRPDEPMRFPELAAQVRAKREQGHKVAELRLMQKELHAMSNRAFNMDFPILGSRLLDDSQAAGNLAKLTEAQ